MDDDDYAKLLLESSFKESNAFWIRNAGFLVAQSLLLGLAVGKDSKPESIIVFAVLGALLALLHFGVLRNSNHYNQTWFNALRSWVDCKAPQVSTDEQSPNDQSPNSWCHLRSTLNSHETLPFPWKHASKLAYRIPFLFVFAWAALVIVAFVESPCRAIILN